MGGYVSMLDEREGPVDPAEAHQAFNRQPLRARAAVVAAGPLANLLLAVLLYAVVNWAGQQEPRAVLASPLADSVAAQAGLKGGEWVTQAGFSPEAMQYVRSFDDLRGQLTDGALQGRDLLLRVVTGQGGSQVTANTSEDLKKMLGGAAYLFTGLTRFSELHAAYAELQGPDFHWHGELLALGIGNGRQAGGGHELCPEASIDDGLLDISILPAPQDVVGTLKDLVADGWGLDNLFVRARLPWVEIKAAEGLSINLDGEPLEGDSMRFAARPGALRVHLPQDSPLFRG